MIRLVFFSVWWIASMAASAQKRDTLQLFYEIDQIRSELNERRIDSLSGSLRGKVYNVWIYGYADFLASDTYNVTLSQKRADAVKTRLLKNSSEPQMTILTCKGKGESFSSDNGTNDGEPFQRRVDLIYEIRPENRVVDTRPIMLPDTGPIDESPSIDVNELKKEGKLTLEGLNFIPGRHTLLEKSVPVLHKLLNIMLRNPELKIEIQGHICCWQYDGDGYDYDSDDMNLSLNRAREVYDFLVENGVDESRLSYKGFGHTRPKVKEVSAETEQMNRRVEIRVVK